MSTPFLSISLSLSLSLIIITPFFLEYITLINNFL